LIFGGLVPCHGASKNISYRISYYKYIKFNYWALKIASSSEDTPDVETSLEIYGNK
jgi:hypothetical protein